MRNNRGASGYFVLLYLLVFFLVFGGLGAYGYFKRKKLEEERQARAEEIEQMLEKDTARTEEEILERLTKAMEEGTSDNVYIRVPGTFTEDDITEIGHKVDPMLGRVTKFYYTTSTTSYSDDVPVEDYYIGLNYSFEVCNEYYVIQSIKNGKSIPLIRDKAAKLKEVTEKVIRECITSGMSDYDKELALHDYLVNNCEYSFSDNNDMSEFEAYGALVNHKAVCSGYSRAMYLLLTCCDIDVKLVSGDAESNVEGFSSGELLAPDGRVVDGHMWNQVKIDGLWYNLDVTWDDPVYTDDVEKDILSHTYFNVDDTILSQNHTWERSDAENCSSTLANYYEKNGIYFHDDESFKEFVKTELANGCRDKIECAVSNANLDEESMYFIFDYDGISSYSIYNSKISGYEVLEININPPDVSSEGE